MEKITVHIDGGSRGNPGPSAAAFVMTDINGRKISAKASFLGTATNNVAEYSGLIMALEAAKKINPKQLTVFSDSELLVKQMNGQYRVKSELLKPLYNRAVDLIKNFESVQLKHIPREKNVQADALLNRALDFKKDIEEKKISKKTNTKPLQLGVLISGGGTTLINILKYIEQGRLNAKVALVISSRSTVAGIERAKNAGLNVKIIRKKDHPDIDEISKCIENELAIAKVDLVIQAGWLCLWKIPARYENRVMNIHPALLPSFGGKGMWGHHVHEAVIKAGCKLSGCTIHFCTNQYDKGPIIVQRCCEVKDDDTPDTLAARVFEQECIAYPQAISLFEEGKIKVKNKRVTTTD